MEAEDLKLASAMLLKLASDKQVSLVVCVAENDRKYGAMYLTEMM